MDGQVTDLDWSLFWFASRPGDRDGEDPRPTEDDLERLRQLADAGDSPS